MTDLRELADRCEKAAVAELRSCFRDRSIDFGGRDQAHAAKSLLDCAAALRARAAQVGRCGEAIETPLGGSAVGEHAVANEVSDAPK
jgi:hypothetical protein